VNGSLHPGFGIFEKIFNHRNLLKYETCIPKDTLKSKNTLLDWNDKVKKTTAPTAVFFILTNPACHPIFPALCSQTL
jgi:hypothetical protein